IWLDLNWGMHGVFICTPRAPQKRIFTVTRLQPACTLGFLMFLRLHPTVTLWLRLHLGLRQEPPGFPIPFSSSQGGMGGLRSPPRIESAHPVSSRAVAPPILRRG